MPQPWTAVVGAGSIGSVLALSLRQSKIETFLIARTQTQVKDLQERGFLVCRTGRTTARSGSWKNAAMRLEARPDCTAVFLCVKSPDLVRCIPSIHAAVGPNTAVVSLLNGISHAPSLRSAFGERRVVFGSCYIAAMRKAPGAFHHSGGRLILLARTPKNAPSAEAARRLLEGAGWKVGFVSSEKRLLWTKLLYNAAVNPLGAALGKTNGELASDPALKELVGIVLNEALAVAKQSGVRPLRADLFDQIIRGCLSVPSQLNSMGQDLKEGRKTEIDSILKPLLNAARANRMKTQTLDPLYRIIKRLEKK